MDAKLIHGATWITGREGIRKLYKNKLNIGHAEKTYVRDRGRTEWIVDSFYPTNCENLPEDTFADLPEAMLYVESKWIFSQQS